MSVSSLENNAAGPFRVKQLPSFEASEDSYIVRDIKAEKARFQVETGGVESTEEPRSNLSILLKYFQYCCAPYQRSRGEKGTNEASHSATQTTNATFEHIQARVASAAEYVGVGNLFNLDTSTESDEENVLEEEAKSGKKRFDWKLQPLSYNPPALSPEQTNYAVLLWCLRLERGERMSETMISEILSTAVSEKVDVNISEHLRIRKEFSILDFVRCVESREVDSIIGDIFNLYSGLDGDRGLYVIISKIRVLGIYARRKGEASDSSVFNPHVNDKENFTSSFLGFKSLEDSVKYVQEEFENDKMVKQYAGKLRFIAWLLRSKKTFEEPSVTLSKNVESAEEDLLNYNEWVKLERERDMDPRSDVKRIYSDVYNITTGSKDEENVFVLDQTGGMQVHFPTDLRESA